jgi:hypothetical protein
MVEIAPVGRRTPSSTVTPILLATVVLVAVMGGITGLPFLHARCAHLAARRAGRLAARQGHGSALLEGLLRDWEAGGYAVVSARNRAIADW